ISVSNLVSAANQVTATVTVSGSAPTTTRNVTVTTPAGTSGSLTFSIGNPIPVLTGIDPNRATENTPVSLTVQGSGFLPNSVIRFNSLDKTTTYVSSNVLTAQIPAADIPVGSHGTKPVTVFNPSPGGGLSGPILFTVVQPSANNPTPHIGSLSPSTL